MAVGVNIVSTFDSKGISRAISDFKKLDGAGNKATFGLRTLDKGLSNTLASFAKVAAGVAVAAGAIGYKLASAAYESQKVMAQTEAIIKATGGAAGVTAKQVSNLSEKLAMQIGVDDELIQKSANLLLTFKQVQNQVGLNNNIFDQAVILSQDLGSVFGSADAAAMQLGKALSDPEKGITALRRAGINFTDAQKEQIKTLVQSGDVLGAQKLILAEVESQVGGTAAATATGFDIMRVAIGNVAEEFGAILIPYIEKFSTFVTNKVVPYLSNLADVLGEQGVGAAIKLLAGDFVNMTTNMGTFGNILLGLTTAFIAFKGVAIAAAISQNLFNVALLNNPIGRVVAILIVLGAAVVAAYLKFEGFRKVVNAVINFIIGLIENWLNAWIRIINAIITGINFLIKGANLFGAGLEEIGKIGEVEFGRIGSAADGARKQIGSVAEVAGAMAAKEGGIQNVVKALNGVAGAAGGVGGAGGAAKAVETAGEKLQKYIDKLKGLTQAQRSYRDSQKGVLKADTDLLEAKTKLADAQAYMNQVLKGYGAGSKQAKDRQKELDKAQRGVERSNYDVEGAVFAVKDAEAELAKLRADPESSAQVIREAEISLAEAKLAVADATDSQTDATNELSTAQLLLQEAISGASESSDTYLEAAKALKDAQIAERDATDQQTAAYERQKDALDALTKAQEEATAAKKGVKPADAAAAEAAANAPVIIGGGETPTTAAPISTGNPLMDSVLDRFTGRARELMLERGGFTAFADGGVVTSPMMGLVGEAGSEAIIPLDRLGEFGGQTINITINAGIGTDASAVGDEIVNVLQRYNRRNGALPLKVA